MLNFQDLVEYDRTGWRGPVLPPSILPLIQTEAPDGTIQWHTAQNIPISFAHDLGNEPVDTEMAASPSNKEDSAGLLFIYFKIFNSLHTYIIVATTLYHVQITPAVSLRQSLPCFASTTSSHLSLGLPILLPCRFIIVQPLLWPTF